MSRGLVKIPGRVAKTFLRGLVQTLLDRAFRHKLSRIGQLSAFDGMGLVPTAMRCAGFGRLV